MRRRILAMVPIIFLFLGSALTYAATETPMLKKYVPFYNYEDTGERLSGYIPALDKNVERGWELSRWDGIYKFADGNKRTVSQYDVFNVKREPDDIKFDKENGFGLVYKSPEALGNLFDSIMNGQTINAKQKKYYRDKFIANADDSVFKQGHPFFYSLENKWEFLRTSGILQRMGIKFDRTNKISDDERQALYEVSKWPELKATVNEKLVLDFSAYGFSERDLRLVAVKKGAFPDMSMVVSLTDDKLIKTDKLAYTDKIQVDYKGIVSQLGRDVDIILEDGYGRTAIQSVTLPEPPEALDFIPTKLTYTDSGQVWLKYKYIGQDFKASDYISGRGIPDIAHVKIGGAEQHETTVQSMFSSNIPAIVKTGDEFSHMIGKVPMGETPGKYYIKVDAFVNNPNHVERAFEAPEVAYENNEIKAEFVVTVEEPPYDLVAQSITASPPTIQKGSHSTLTAQVKNIGQFDQKDVLIRFTADGETIYEARKLLPANKPQSVGPFVWEGTESGMHNITVHVDPKGEKDKDTNPGNNITSTSCYVMDPNGGGTSCKGTNASKSWNTTYTYISGYDSSGHPIWRDRTVTYNENLNIAAQVDTKQGIKTDLNHPKASDKDSRGSWEIIPYAKTHGLNPNEVTRAGYGFEIKATTAYTTDWETRIPRGLEGTPRPVGGVYYGPDEVTATIHDSKGNFVKSIKLERTGGDRNHGTWELPLQTVKSASGQVYKDRKFYTGINVPDGEYTVKLTTSRAGMHGLVSCITKKVRIFGSMYDDVQNLRTVN
ncbi:CARDB domain-containing protein [Paenibacillus polymyxa]|uniref:CARDB domain-containing protein n=1 Tax=Paenibacillus polymyxa TaxID=1406 RepID=UPI0025B6C415|nr:CARDB domain-containing protein [Paenibacillus polymyxa]MDN4090920.1 CARDB domain-containing protein [Paenibacillus polymyxa]